MHNPLSRRTVSWLLVALMVPASFLVNGGERISARAQDALDTHPHEMVDLIVTYHQRPAAADRAKVKSNGGSIRHEFKAIRGHAIRVPARAARTLENNPNVERISLDEPVSGAVMSTLDDGLYTVTGASTAIVASLPSSVTDGVAGLDTVPYTGAGVKVAVVDSGYKNHGDLNPSFKVSLVGNKADDENGHGNHVSAIVVGDGSDSSGLYRGIAPDADLVTVRVLDEVGQGLSSDVIAGLDEILALNQLYWHVRVVNMSLGHPVYQPSAEDPLVQAVEAIWDSGVVVICSAGNAGRDGTARTR